MKRILILIFFIAVIANAETILVRNAVEIKNAMQTASPGDTLVMQNGLWTDQLVVFQGNGTADQPIVLMAETPGYVILNGYSILRISGEYLVVDGLQFIGGYARSGAVIEFRNGSSKPAHNCRLTNTTIIDYNPDSKSYDYKWVSLYGTFNRVDHCHFKGKSHSGTTLVVWLNGDPNYHQIDHNYFGYRPELGFNGGETIRIGTSDYSMSDSWTIVENNYFENCNGETEIISNKSAENIYRYNTFFECEGTLTLRHGNRCTVEGNFFFGNNNYDAGGVRIIGEDHKVFNNYFYQLNGDGYRSALCIMNGVPNSPLNRYYQVKRAQVVHNTFVDCRHTFTIGAGANDELSLPPLDCVIANNAVSTENTIFEFDDDPLNLVYEGNIVNGPLGMEQPEGITINDPLYALAEDGLWRPQQGSPLFGNAIENYDFVINDMDGQPRENGFDVGADQYSSAPIINSPVSAGNTGPSWLSSVSLPFLLTTRTSGEGNVVLEPESGLYEYGQMVTITAVADSGWRFSHWTGDVESDINPISIEMTDNFSVQAVFELDGPVQYTLSAYVFSGGGQVQLSPASDSYDENTTVIVTAIPDEGWEFTSWSGDMTGNTNPDTIVMNSDKSIVAGFTKIPTFVDENTIPNTFALLQNYPNPFNPSTEIKYQVPIQGHVHLAIYNYLGQTIRVLVDQVVTTGVYKITWDGTTDNGQHVNSGVYLYRLRTNEFTQTNKMIMVK